MMRTVLNPETAIHYCHYCVVAYEHCHLNSSISYTQITTTLAGKSSVLICEPKLDGDVLIVGFVTEKAPALLLTHVKDFPYIRRQTLSIPCPLLELN